MSKEALLDKSAGSDLRKRSSAAKFAATDEEVINFKRLLKDHRQRTEQSTPFTI